MKLPIKVRLTAWYLTLLSVILVALGAFLYLRLRSNLVDAVDRSLESRAAQIALGFQGGDQNFQDVSDASLQSVTPVETAAQLVTPAGAVLDAAGDPTLTDHAMIDAHGLAAALQGRRTVASVMLGPDGKHFRVLALRLPEAGGSSVLVVSSSLEDVDSSIHRLLVLFATGVPGALLVAAIGGWLIARKALRPVGRMTAEAQEIRADRLKDRIAIPPTDDELQRLARTLNDMLGRLEEGIESQRRFVADASHDMRTPLTVMASEIDVGLETPRLGERRARELLTSNREQVAWMARMIDDLLTLASIEGGQLELLRTPTDLHALAGDVVARLGSFATSTGVRISADGGPASVIGDSDRLTQVLTNLVENAVKYAGTGAEVRVLTWQRDEEAGFTVTDTGPGIPPEAIPHLFDRFFREDSTRSSARRGSGLGLAICREIIDAHGGHIWVDTTGGGGSSFSVALPAH